MSNKIKVLDAEVVKRIAAGETLQRPVNAVKELIENSLDAGADRISVHLQVPVNSSSTETSAGLFSIQVTDNGSGIGKADLELLCERHATSKLVSVSDLRSVGTFGFRGEALASCSQVGRVEVITRSREDADRSEVAWKASYVTGKMTGEPVPVAGNFGTIITVKDLFYANRVRREALLSSSEEYQKIVQVMQAYALNQAGKCAFALSKRRDKMELQTSIGDGAVAVVKNLWSEEIGASLMPFTVESDAKLGIECGSGGWASRTTFHKLKSPQVIIFLNGRLIEHMTLRRAILQAFALHLPTHPPAHPFVYLNLRLKGSRVDVNVHPSKKQVIFVDEAEVVERVISALDESVLRRQYETQALKPIIIEPTRDFEAKKTKISEGIKCTTSVSNVKQQPSNRTAESMKISALYPSQRVLTDSKNHRIDTFLYHSSQKVNNSGNSGSGWSPLSGVMKTAVKEKENTAVDTVIPKDTTGKDTTCLNPIFNNINQSSQSETSIILDSMSSQECSGCCKKPGDGADYEPVDIVVEAKNIIPSESTIEQSSSDQSSLIPSNSSLNALLSNANEQLSRLLRDSLVVGLVDSQWALLQSSTNLLLCDMDRLNFDMFFSLLAQDIAWQREFEIGMRVRVDGFEGEEESIGREAEDILKKHSKDLADKFGIKFVDYNDELKLQSLPAIIPGQKCPSVRFIKTFLHRLCLCLLDENDGDYYVSVIRELADLYALIDFDSDESGGWEEYVKHVILPAYRDSRAKFTLRNEFRGGQEDATSSLSIEPPVKIITNTETLYKSFERC